MAEKILRAVVEKTIDYICDDCGVGQMRPTGARVMLPGGTIEYDHVCRGCGATIKLLDTYPKVEKSITS